MAKTAWALGLATRLGPLARLRRVLASLFIFIGLLLILAAWPHPPVADLVATGDRALARGDIATAYGKFTQAMYRYPEDANLHLKLARVYEAAQDYDRATAELVQAQTLNPDLNLAAELGQFIGLRDEPQALRENLARIAAILSSYPEYRDAWFRAAYLHYRLREDYLAKEALTRTLEIDPNYEPALKLRAALP